MKLDMHCHVKEGSPDSKVPLDEYITKLKDHPRYLKNNQ